MKNKLGSFYRIINAQLHRIVQNILRRLGDIIDLYPPYLSLENPVGVPSSKAPPIKV